MTLASVIVIILTGLMLIPLLYFLTESEDMFSPIGFIGLFSLTYYVGPAIHFILMSETQRELLLLNNGLWYLIPGLTVCLVGIWTLLVGWNWGKTRVPKLDIAAPTNVDHATLRRIEYIFGIIGIVGLILFVRFTGGIPSEVSDISSKRDPPTEYIRAMTDFLFLASLFTWSRYVTSDHSMYSKKLIYPLGSLAVAMFPAFYASQRGRMIMVVIAHLIIIHYLHRRIKFREILPLAPIGILIVGVMHWLRQISRDGTVDIDVANLGLVSDSLTSTFGADFGSLTVITHLVHKVPAELGYRYGITMFKWIVFPIPRAVWPGKPVNIGQVLASSIYSANNGTPPTLIGELYFNFDIFGVLFGMALMGLVLRAVYTNLIDKSQHTPIIVVLYISVMVSGLGLSDVTKLMTTLLVRIVPLLLVFFYVTRHRFSDTISVADSE